MSEEENDEKKKFPLAYMIRPCDIYDKEFYECERPKARFHQYFIYGDYLNCWQWQTDYYNCKKWVANKDEEAYEELIISERKRKVERLKGHYQNDVWKRREKPPENWDAPLPEWLVKKNENTYLDLKAKDIKAGKVNDYDLHIYESCSIL